MICTLSRPLYTVILPPFFRIPHHTTAVVHIVLRSSYSLYHVRHTHRTAAAAPQQIQHKASIKSK